MVELKQCQANGNYEQDTLRNSPPITGRSNGGLFVCSFSNLIIAVTIIVEFVIRNAVADGSKVVPGKKVYRNN